MRITLFLTSCFFLFFLNAESNVQPSWIDLPTSSYLCHMGFSSQIIETISHDLDHYHSKNKESLESLSKRIDNLAQILRNLNHLDKKEMSQSDLVGVNLLTKILCSKKVYLTQIKKIYTQNLVQEMKNYHLEISRTSHLPSSPLILRNERIYSLRMREFWGDFWWESLDPCHRRLSPYIHMWEEQNKSDKKTAPFFLWLENQHVPNNYPQVTYFEEDELTQFNYIISEGLIEHTLSGKPLDCTPDTRYIYVISLDEKLYIAPFKKGIWHSSFSKGKPVMASGVLVVKNGILRTLSIESGHYFPSIENGYQSLSFLKNQGIAFDEIFEVCFYENKKKYSVDITPKDLESYLSFYLALKDESRRVLRSSCEF